MRGYELSACTSRLAETESAAGVVVLSIIIINWNSCKYLRSCLNSIRSTTSDLIYEVVVVDNASFDGCAAMLASEFPETILIQSEQNLGFAKANNLAVSKSSGRNLLFLNPDTVVMGSAINNLVMVLENSPEIGMVGPRILNSDLSLQTTCIMPVPTILNQFLNIDVLRKFYTWRRLGSRFAQGNGPISVAAISGACMMVKRTAMEEIDHFCEDYFMYVEDIDLCVRVRQAGWKVHHIRSAEIIHFGGGSSALQTSNQFSSIMICESVLQFFLLRRGRWYAALYRPTIAATALLHIIILTLLGFFSREQPRMTVPKAKWRNLLSWSLGRSAWSTGTGVS
ncbi:glycosyltransferase family 2 protein [Granulicella arctica]|uniref:glycosyltransferase family 2 protein n=1 Tax=Granulicella arctica TaxID=940613 RepID=UPI0021E087AB|nr:glycosyltransferase family 2 protein [Granulicella arctica]